MEGRKTEKKVEKEMRGGKRKMRNGERKDGIREAEEEREDGVRKGWMRQRQKMRERNFE